MAGTKRFSDAELEIFKIHIEQKLEKSKADLDYLIERIDDISDAQNNEGDLMDNTSNTSEREMLSTMANRNKHHIRDLENSLIRIRNKSYGICTLTGELIDKRRLMAVPTTSKTLAAKNASLTPVKKQDDDDDDEDAPVKKKPSAPKAFSRIIRKINPVPKPANSIILEDDDEEDEDDDFLFEEDFENGATFEGPDDENLGE